MVYSNDLNCVHSAGVFLFLRKIRCVDSTSVYGVLREIIQGFKYAVIIIFTN